MPHALSYIFSIVTSLVYKTSISEPIKVDAAIALASFKPRLIPFRLAGGITYLCSLRNPIDRVV